MFRTSVQLPEGEAMKARARLRRLSVLLVAPVLALGVTGVASAARGTATQVKVTFTDTKFFLSPAGLQAGKTIFLVVNTGRKPHALAIAGPGLKGIKTPRLPAGKQARLTVTLGVGAYALSDAAGKANGRWLVVGPATVVQSTGSRTGSGGPETSTVGMNCD
jgi:hypothetical protein